MKIFFLLPLIGQPRFSKRIELLRSEGASVRAAAFERDYHKGRALNCNFEVLGNVNHGRYLSRIVTYFRSIAAIRKQSIGYEVIYCFGVDMVLLACFATLGHSKKIVMEVGDVREIQTAESIKGRLVRAVEKTLLRKVSLLVVTAPKYYSEYYQKRLGVDMNNIVVENKLEFEQPRSIFGSKHRNNEYVTIGYFGLLRCEWSLEALYVLARRASSSIRIILAGFKMTGSDYFNKLIQLRNVSYLGEYKSPDGLEALYEQVDVVWACYEPLKGASPNLHWAKTNRFYESIYFGKPIIARAGSTDGEFVEAMEIGVALSETSPSNAASSLLGLLSNSSLEYWSNNVERVPSSCYLYGNEHSSVIKILSNS